MKHFIHSTALFIVMACQLSAAATTTPNILFIAVDDMRDWAGFMGNAQAKTPNFDRLAKIGMSFTRAYTASALCNPSRTALLSGLRPGSTGVYGYGDDWRADVPADVLTLPDFQDFQPMSLEYVPLPPKVKKPTTK